MEPALNRRRKNGFTLLEIVIVVAIMTVLGVVTMVALTGKKSSNDLSSTVAQATALLREAENRSVTQTQGASWGVHFSNATATTPFYALFSLSYGPTTTINYYRLPINVAYVPSTLPIGSSLDVMFSQVSGMSLVSTTVGFFNTSQPMFSSGIGIALSGAIGSASVSVMGPSIASISPNATTTGAAQFTLTVTGALFTPSSTVQWNGLALATSTFVSSSSFTAVVPAANLLTAGTASVTVFSPSGGSSNAQIFTINNLAPTLSSINPTSTTAGSSSFTLTITGTNFVPTSGVNWNGIPLVTTYGSATSLMATVPAANIASGGAITVTVTNPAPGGGTSGSQTFTVNNLSPTLASISPTSTNVGGSQFILTTTGTNYVPTSVVKWNGSALATTFVSSTTLQGTVPSGNITATGTDPVTVTSAAPGGGTSGSQTFTITSFTLPAPVIASISPSSTVAGSATTTLTVTGSNFLSSSTVQWNGSSFVTTYGSGSSLIATIPTANLVTAGTASVTVINPGTSNSMTFTITSASNPMPILTSISPTSTTAGGSSFTLTANGSSFVSGATINWNGVATTTTYVSSSSLAATISASSIASAGTIPVTVTNPAPGGGTSASSTFTILPPPATTTITTAAQTGLGLTVDGAGCTSPCYFSWMAGTNHTVTVSSTISGGAGTQYIYASWSDGGAISHTITASSSPVTYTANLTTQYYLTTVASSSAGGSISPASGWYNANSAPSVSATPNSGYSFSGFTGALNGTTTPQNVAAMIAPITVTANFITSTGYAYMHSITVPHANVSATLSYFPMLVSGTYSWLAATSSSGYVQNPNGYDVIFTSDAGCTTKLNWETESYASNGAVNYWVRIPSLSSTVDTVIYACYGNSSITTDQSHPSLTWDGNYMGVWHFPGGSGFLNDSTVNAENGTGVGSPASDSGQIGSALSLNGTTQWAYTPTMPALTSYTISFWVKPATKAYYTAIVGPYNGGYFLAFGGGSSMFSPVGSYGVGSTLNSWEYYTLIETGSQSESLYKNGALIEAWNGNGSGPISSQAWEFGTEYAGWIGFLSGSLDELRVSNVARSPSWILTEYNNQLSPSTFYTVQ